MNTCSAGHQVHDVKVIHSDVGDLVAYDWEKYMGFAGYCTGQDGVSQTIEREGYWDPAVKNAIQAILQTGDRGNYFFDIGSHIGYFSRLADTFGYKVMAYDGDAENVALLHENVPSAAVMLKWFGEGIEPMDLIHDLNIECVKIDIEGLEEYAIKFLHEYLRTKRINNLIIEISPCFNNSYPYVVGILSKYGYSAFELDGTPFNNDFNFHQKDLWFKKQ